MLPRGAADSGVRLSKKYMHQQMRNPPWKNEFCSWQLAWDDGIGTNRRAPDNAFEYIKKKTTSGTSKQVTDVLKANSTVSHTKLCEKGSSTLLSCMTRLDGNVQRALQSLNHAAVQHEGVDEQASVDSSE